MMVTYAGHKIPQAIAQIKDKSRQLAMLKAYRQKGMRALMQPQPLSQQQKSRKHAEALKKKDLNYEETKDKDGNIVFTTKPVEYQKGVSIFNPIGNAPNTESISKDTYIPHKIIINPKDNTVTVEEYDTYRTTSSSRYTRDIGTQSNTSYDTYLKTIKVFKDGNLVDYKKKRPLS